MFRIGSRTEVAPQVKPLRVEQHPTTTHPYPPSGGGFMLGSSVGGDDACDAGFKLSTRAFSMQRVSTLFGSVFNFIVEEMFEQGPAQKLSCCWYSHAVPIHLRFGF